MEPVRKRYKSEMTEAEREESDHLLVTKGPLSMLTECSKNHTQVLISMRDGHKLLGRVKAFDRHFNMVMEDVKDIWTVKDVIKDRFITKMFVRGDGVVLVVKAPKKNKPAQQEPVSKAVEQPKKVQKEVTKEKGKEKDKRARESESESDRELRPRKKK